VTNAILDTSGVQYDIDKLIYLGSPVSVFHYVFLTRKEAGLNSLEKLRAATGVRIGAQEVGHDIYITGRLFAYLMNLKEPRFVTGYGGPERHRVGAWRVDGRANAAKHWPSAMPRKKKATDLHALVEIRAKDGWIERLPKESFAKPTPSEIHHVPRFRLVGTPYIRAGTLGCR
jgi:hypothetical protein